MRKLTPLALAVFGLTPLAAQADVFDARAMARGGAGLTLGEYNQAMINPALVNNFDENDDFSFALNVGVFASDKDGMIDATEDAQDALDALESNPQPGDSATVNNLLQSLDGRIVQIEAGTGLMIAIPNATLATALVVRSKVAVGTEFDYDGGDAAVLTAIENGLATTDDLNSQQLASAIGLAEAGLMFGKKVGDALELGAMLKAQRIELAAQGFNVASFEEEDVLDEGNKESYNHINVDLGLKLRLGDNGQYVLAGVIENLIPKSFDGPAATGGSAEYKMEPVLTAAAAYSGSHLKAELNLDLTVRNGYDLLAETQFARAGVELSAGRHFHLRAGYRADLKDNVSDVATLGIGITPFDRFNIDLAGMKGDGDTYGVALQIGFKI